MRSPLYETVVSKEAALKQSTNLQFILLLVGKLTQVDASDLGANGGGKVLDRLHRGKQSLLLGIGELSTFSYSYWPQRRPLHVRKVRLRLIGEQT